MEINEGALIVLFLGELGIAVYLLISAVRTPADKPGARFISGWLGAFGLMLGLSGGTGLAAVLAVFGVGSTAGVLAAVVLNVVFQPIALLMCWTATRKIVLGVRGQIAYAWRRIPDAELVDTPLPERRQLAWFCVLQGVVVLPFGAAICAVTASPLILWLVV